MPPARPGNTRPPDVRMTWADLLFLHWPVDPALLRPLVPEPLELDLHNSTAWVALVPFRMANSRFRGVPNLPGLADFYECNVRTYARYRGLAGVWFFSLDAATTPPVIGGRHLWSLNYVHSRFAVTHHDHTFDYALTRRPGPWAPGSTHVRWTCGKPLSPASPGSLEHFLTERYWLFTKRHGRIMAGEVWHEPWPLHTATVHHLDDTLLHAAGLHVTTAPVALASPSIDVLGWKLRDPQLQHAGPRSNQPRQHPAKVPA